MLSPNVEVQCNAVGCVTNLATHGKSSIEVYCKHHIFAHFGVSAVNTGTHAPSVYGGYLAGVGVADMVVSSGFCTCVTDTHDGSRLPSLRCRNVMLYPVSLVVL